MFIVNGNGVTSIGNAIHVASSTAAANFHINGILNASSTSFFSGLASLSSGLISTASSTFTANLQIDKLFASTTLQIPYAAQPTIVLAGMAIDTTSGFLLSATSSVDVPVVYARPVKRLYSFSIASTTINAGGFTTTDTLPFPADSDAYVVYYVHCNVWGGTSITIQLTDSNSTNDTNTVVCNTATSTERAITTNNSWTAGEGMTLQITAVSGTPNRLNVSVFGSITRD